MPDTELDEKTVEDKDEHKDTGGDSTVSEVDADAPDGKIEGAETKEPHPLDAGGERFREVWARAKKAESETQREREARLVAEAKLETYKELGVGTGETPKEEKVYSWKELQTFIDDGRMTQADAAEYREAQVVKRVKAEASREAEDRIRKETRLNSTSQELSSYIKEVPDITVAGTKTREQVEEEFRWLSSMYGTPKKGSIEERTMELNAVRNVLGPIDKVSTMRDSDRRTRSNRETMAESNSTSHRQSSGGPGKDPVAGLTPAQKEHYERMFKTSNAYPDGWDSVREELKFKAPRGR